MLGYFMDIEDPGFQEVLFGFRQGRLARGEGMVHKLAEFGMHIEWARVLEIAGDASVGRPHVAQALVEAGYFTEPGDAFREYLGRNGKAYVERSKLTPPDAVKLLNDVGGVAVFAHPWFERRRQRAGARTITDRNRGRTQGCRSARDGSTLLNV